MNGQRVVVVVVMLALSLGALAACGPKQTAITVEMEEFAFTPTAWTVPAGAEVTVNMVNNGGLEHEWAVMELGYTAVPPFDEEDEAHVLWDGEVGPGESAAFVFTAPSEPGQYQVVCGVLGHFENQMVGSLTVTR